MELACGRAMCADLRLRSGHCTLPRDILMCDSIYIAPACCAVSGAVCHSLICCTVKGLGCRSMNIDDDRSRRFRMACYGAVPYVRERPLQFGAAWMSIVILPGMMPQMACSSADAARVHGASVVHRWRLRNDTDHNPSRRWPADNSPERRIIRGQVINGLRIPLATIPNRRRVCAALPGLRRVQTPTSIRTSSPPR